MLIPFDRPVFGQLADAVSYAKMTPDDRREYDRNLKAYRDYVNTIDFAYAEGEQKGEQKGLEKGRQEGRQEGMRELISGMLRNGVTIDAISGLIGMTTDKINAILKL